MRVYDRVVEITDLFCVCVDVSVCACVPVCRGPRGRISPVKASSIPLPLSSPALENTA